MNADPKSGADPRADAASRIRLAFPNELAGDVEIVISRLPPPNLPTSSADVGPVRISGEPIRIPCRVYVDEPSAATILSFTDTQRAILSCIYTRHHDGFVRQRHLKNIGSCAFPWSVPFVVQLVGEYVLEILEEIDANLSRVEVDNVASFVRENGPFMQLTGCRVVSYWNCKFRPAYPRMHNHVGCRILMRIAAMVAPDSDAASD